MKETDAPIFVDYTQIVINGDPTPLQQWFDSHPGAQIQGIFNNGNNIYIAWRPTVD